MLSKRTNILFEENVFRYLVSLATKKGTSVGDLVRNAVYKVYLREDHTKRVDSYDRILFMRLNVKKIKSSDIRDFIDYGRRN